MYRNSRSYKPQTQNQCMDYVWAGNHLVRMASQHDDDNEDLTGPFRTNSLTKLHCNYIGMDYKLTAETPSISIITSYINNDNVLCDQKFALAMTEFYESLSSNQVSLGYEIESLVSKSLWDLYLD